MKFTFLRDCEITFEIAKVEAGDEAEALAKVNTATKKHFWGDCETIDGVEFDFDDDAVGDGSWVRGAEHSDLIPYGELKVSGEDSK
jgi:hypothetical protein